MSEVLEEQQQEQDEQEQDDGAVFEAVLEFAHDCVRVDAVWGAYWAAAAASDPGIAARDGAEEKIRRNIHAAIDATHMRVQVARLMAQLMAQRAVQRGAYPGNRVAEGDGPVHDVAGLPLTYL